MNSKQFAEEAKKRASWKTAYMWGCYGQRLTASVLLAKANQYPAYYTDDKKNKLFPLADKGYVCYDCSGLIKGILWGATEQGEIHKDKTKCPDKTADGFFASCTYKSTDMSHIEVGEVLHMKGHIGIYIGEGLCVECTPAFAGGVQIRGLNKAVGSYGRSNHFIEHGKLPFVDYGIDCSDKFVGDVRNSEHLRNIGR